MSIQQSVHSGILYRIYVKLKLTSIYDSFLKIYQFVFRELLLIVNSKKKIEQKFFLNIIITIHIHILRKDIMEKELQCFGVI